MLGGMAALRGQAIDVEKRWLCVAVALVSLLMLLPSLPGGEAGCAELITADGDDAQQPPAAFVALDDDDDDGVPASTAGELPVALGPVVIVAIGWVVPDEAKPTYARLEHAPTVRAPPGARV